MRIRFDLDALPHPHRLNPAETLASRMDGAQPVHVATTRPIVDPQPRRLETWFHSPWLWAVWPALFGAAIGLGFVGDEALPFSCYAVNPPRGCGAARDLQAFLFALTTMAAVTAGTVLVLCLVRLASGLRAHRGRASVLSRLQAAKEWFLRGDLDEGEYAALEASFKAHVEPSAPGPRRAAAAVGLLLVGIPLAVTAVVFVFLFLGDAFVNKVLDHDDFVLVGSLCLYFVAVAYVSLFNGVRLFAQSRILKKNASESLDRTEFEILQRARARRLGGVQPAGRGPSFQAWR